MNRNSEIYQTYVEILKAELKPAMGCTEPIALAYCAAKAKEALGEAPVSVKVLASGNIIKNVKSVVVPNTGGLRGIEAAAAVGAFYGDARKKLEVIAAVSAEEAKSLKEVMEQVSFKVEPLDSDHVLDMIVELQGQNHTSSCRIWDTHTNIVEITRDDKNLSLEETGSAENISNENEIEVDRTEAAANESASLNYDLLTVADIFDFANTAELSDVEEVLSRQMEYNMAIAKAGMQGSFGARIGQTIRKQGEDAKIQAKAFAAAASDARMGGCELPVVINSGSGNQGITTSIPVMIYGEKYGKNREEVLRALLMSNLVTLHLKSGIGRLSAYCGAVSAGVGAGAGIAYLLTGDLKTINHTIVNSIAITSGIVCDGAKASCAAKISMAVEAGILGFEMYQDGNQFYAGEGLVEKGVENTIRNISLLGHDGMLETDKKIIEIMTGCV